MNAEGKPVDIYFVVWNTDTWDIVKNVLSKFHRMLVMNVDMCMQELDDGVQLIWKTYYEVNFWNVDTGKESMALKQVRNLQYFTTHSNDSKLTEKYFLDLRNVFLNKKISGKFFSEQGNLSS